MNVPPEQIGSVEAGRPRRPRRSAQLRMLTSKGELKGVEERERERRLGQTLQRPLWLMPALICSSAKLNDDVIAGLRAKSAPIQIKVEVFPCSSTMRKVPPVLSWSQKVEHLTGEEGVWSLWHCTDPGGKCSHILNKIGNGFSYCCRFDPRAVSKVHNRWNRVDSVLCKVYTGLVFTCMCVLAVCVHVLLL